MTLEDLIKFLSEQGIEVPKESTSDQVITIIKTLLSGEDAPETKDEEEKEEVPAEDGPVGLA